MVAIRVVGVELFHTRVTLLATKQCGSETFSRLDNDYSHLAVASSIRSTPTGLATEPTITTEKTQI